MSLHLAVTGEVIHPISEWGKSLTRQSELKYADINVIMAKYFKEGVLPPATREGFFADVSKVGDYQDALARVETMDRYFEHLHPDVRKRFDHDPAKFLDFVSDDQNLGELEEMGVIAKSNAESPAPGPHPPEPRPVPEEPVPPAAGGAPSPEANPERPPEVPPEPTPTK